MSLPDQTQGPPIGALTIAGFTKLYNVSRTFLYGELSAGRLKAHKAGTRTLILKSDAQAWASSLPVLGASQ